MNGQEPRYCVGWCHTLKRWAAQLCQNRGWRGFANKFLLWMRNKSYTRASYRRKLLCTFYMTSRQLHTERFGCTTSEEVATLRQVHCFHRAGESLRHLVRGSQFKNIKLRYNPAPRLWGAFTHTGSVRRIQKRRGGKCTNGPATIAFKASDVHRTLSASVVP